MECSGGGTGKAEGDVSLIQPITGESTSLPGCRPRVKTNFFVSPQASRKTSI
jgi:hypothetical protein